MIGSASYSGTIAVTCAGWGEFWLFESFDEADQHPLIQYGDVICSGPDRILSQYNRLDLPDLLRELGDESLRTEVLSAVASLGPERAMARHKDRIWGLMHKRASEPPHDAERILEMIREDRLKSKGERTMTETAEAAVPTAQFTDEMKITLLADDEGKPFGAKNNPKRDGSKSAERFALYKNGMKVAKFKDLGGRHADLKNDTERNYISVG